MDVAHWYLAGTALLASCAVTGLVLWQAAKAWRRQQNKSVLIVGLYVVGGVVVSLVTYRGLLTSAHKPPLQPPNPPSILMDAQRNVLQILDRAVQGSVAASAPKIARQLHPFPVQLTVTPANLPSAYKQLLATGEAGVAVVGADDIILTPEMEARASGEGFTFGAKEREAYSQAVAFNRPTTWRWMVTPTTPGKQVLRLTLSAKVKVPQRDQPVDYELPPTTFSIEVKVDPIQYVMANALVLAPMLGAVIAAIAAAFWALFTWLKPKREHPTPPAAPQAPPPAMSPFPKIPRPSPKNSQAHKPSPAPPPGTP